MKLIVLSSSSKGNCYVLQNQNEALVIEAGVSLKEVKKAVDFNVSKIVGVIVSHEHGDHSKYMNDFLNNRINVYASYGTVISCQPMTRQRNFLPLLFEDGCKCNIGRFTVLPFNVKHDASEPLGFLISHPEIGTMLFATDTYYLPYNFAGLTNISLS